ncbi:MAG: anti-sigma factor [Thermoleophilia bacterium]|nr:anti-sigma factor [Thermoleophilia bacterium]
MTGHDELRELLASVALGAATPEESDLVARHVAGCGDCRAELRGLRAAASGLALDVPQLEVPASVKASVMDVVRREAAAVAPPPVRAPGLRERLGALLPARAGLWPAVAAGLAAVVIGLAVWGGAFGGGGSVRTVPGVCTAAGVSCSAEVRGDDAVLRVTGLPALPAGRGYEVWLIRDGRDPVSAGFMAPGADGRLTAVAEGLDGVRALAVTPEALGNTSAPTSSPIVTVPLPAA